MKNNQTRRPFSRKWLALMAAVQCFSTQDADAILHNNQAYGYIYWEHGNPIVSPRYWGVVNPAAEANPDVIIQTGYYSLRFDCDDVQLTGFDAVSGSDYMSALTEDVTTFSPADMDLSVTVDGVVYTCVSGDVRDGYNLNVRLVEAGQYLQRFDHQGLVFEDDQGNQLGAYGRIEICAWPERVTFTLDFRDVNGDPVVTGITDTSIDIVSPNGTQFSASATENHVSLGVMPQFNVQIGVQSPSVFVNDAINVSDNSALDVSFDEVLGAVKIDLANEKYFRWPADIDQVDEFEIEVTNPVGGPITIPLVFDEGQVGAITGTSMVLLDDVNYGAPLGQPVQISKNWHWIADQPMIHDGSWLRGSTVLTLDANETKRFRLKVVRGNWGAQPAASHAHLSLIGWGGNWKWDESALGGWGESMCFDPTQSLGGAFLSDIRPSFTTSMSGGTHNWTDSSGGGNFLVYYDSNNEMRLQKRVKTAYKWTGPNVTEVHYSGVTDDDKIRFTYKNRLGRTFDYQRRFLDFKYEFLQDVNDPTRLVFYQMAADRYYGPAYDYYDLGDDNGLIATHAAEKGGDTYKGSFPFNDRWLAIDDLVSMEGNASHARRGIIARDFSLNGAAMTPHVHKWGNSWAHERMFFDISSDAVTNSYSAGDVVEGGVEFLMVPVDSAAYWGSDSEFAGRLATHQNEWDAVYDEVKNNDDLVVTATWGTVEENFPVSVKANTTNAVLADITIQNGGIGSVPITITDVPAGGWVIVQRFVNGTWQFLENVNLLDSDYYQGYFNADGNIDYSFNIKRPSTDLSESWRLRVLKGW
ncbi:hypothetical protein [Rubritalea marina]|uniref:hypothetical protein n=1 Tax=Rubritalea marina TaxID=361055 RepID=UPI0012E9CE06|nr:hypothetical protein [Rubritalea marina]